MPRKSVVASKRSILQRQESLVDKSSDSSSSLGLKIISVDSLQPSLSSKFDGGWSSELKCTRCEKDFKDLSPYYAHKQDYSAGPLHCKSCSESLTSQCDLNFHEKVHNEEKLWCKACQVRFKTLQVAQDHKNQCHPVDETSDQFVNTETDDLTNDAVTLTIDIPTEKETSDDFKPLTIKCPMCPYESGELIRLLHHVQQCKHLLEDSNLVFCCSKCEFSSSNRSAFGDHFMHKLIYGACPASNSRKRLLVREAYSQGSDILNKKQAMASELQDSDEITIIHEETRPRSVNILEENVVEPSPPSPPKTKTTVLTKVKLLDHSTKGLVFTCPKCKKNYFTARSLEEHLKIDCCVQHFIPVSKRRESIASDESQTFGCSFSCHYCKRSLTSVAMIKDHGALCPYIPSAEMSFIICNDCGCLLKGLTQYNRHSDECTKSPKNALEVVFIKCDEGSDF